MQNKTNIYDQFNHRYYTTLYSSNKEEALKYIQNFNTKKTDDSVDRKMMQEKLKKHGIKIFPNYTDDTVKRKYDELILSLKNNNADNNNAGTDIGSDIQ